MVSIRLLCSVFCAFAASMCLAGTAVLPPNPYRQHTVYRDSRGNVVDVRKPSKIERTVYSDIDGKVEIGTERGEPFPPATPPPPKFGEPAKPPKAPQKQKTP